MVMNFENLSFERHYYWPAIDILKMVRSSLCTYLLLMTELHLGSYPSVRKLVSALGMCKTCIGSDVFMPIEEKIALHPENTLPIFVWL